MREIYAKLTVSIIKTNSSISSVRTQQIIKMPDLTLEAAQM